MNDTSFKEISRPLDIKIDLHENSLEFLDESQIKTVTDSEAAYVIEITDEELDDGNNTITDDDKKTVPQINLQTKKPQTDSLRELQAKYQEPPRPPLPEFDLKTVLETSALGFTIINYYQENKILDNTHRNRLVDIVVKHLFNYIAKHRLRQNDYQMIVANIVYLFPNERCGTYYNLPIKKSNSTTGKPIYAKGKLIDKVRNIIAKSGETIKAKQKRAQISSIGTSPLQGFVSKSKLETDFHQDLIWLKVNNEPWAEVLNKWNKTYPLRAIYAEKTVAQFLEKWPILTDRRSETLINLDFSRRFPNKDLCFYLNFKPFFEKVVAERKCAHKNLDELFASLKLIPDESEQTAIQLTILGYLIPPRGSTKISGNVHWKYSRAEAMEGIVKHVNGPEEIEKAILNQREKAILRNQPVQPYVIVEGESLMRYRSILIVMDEVRYKFNNPRKAFDTLFKLYHVLNAEYPLPSQHLYVLIQRCVYQIVNETDNIAPFIRDLL